MLIKDMILNEIKLQLYSLVRQLEMLENEWFHPAIVEYYELCMMVSWCVFSYILSQRIKYYLKSHKNYYSSHYYILTTFFYNDHTIIVILDKAQNNPKCEEHLDSQEIHKPQPWTKFELIIDIRMMQFEAFF